MKKVTLFLFLFSILFISKAHAIPTNEDDVNKHAYDLINVQEMWDAGFTGEGVNIAILDNGVGHNNRLHSEFNQNKITSLLDCSSYPDFDCLIADYDDDYTSHGTSVAGIIGAQHNSVGLKGIAPNTKILPFKVNWEVNFFGNLSVFNALNGIYDYNNSKTSDKEKIHIINMSFEMATFPRVEEVLKKLHEQGVLLVAAGGNSNGSTDVIDDKVAFPASLDYVIGVANVHENGQRFSAGLPEEGVTSKGGSLVGTGLDIAAPGVNIWSTVTDYGETEGNDYYNIRTGTSFSAPIVTGYLALLKEQFPNDSAQMIREKLIANAVPRPSDLNEGEIGYKEYGNGILQAVPYGVKSTVIVTSNTKFYQIPNVDYLSTYKVTKDTEMKVYLEWRNPVDSTDAWLKVGTNLWIKSSIVQKVGEPIETRNVYVDENTKAYAFPWKDETTIDLSEYIIPGIYSSSRGYIEMGLTIANSKTPKEYQWHHIQIGEQNMWVKAKAIHQFRTSYHMNVQRQDVVHDYPSIGKESQEFGHTQSTYTGKFINTQYGYDYNAQEKRFNWYAITTPKGLKWYPSKYADYRAEKSNDSNGFEDGVISSWNDYVTSEPVLEFRNHYLKNTVSNLLFEEYKLFNERDFNALYNQYKTYSYKYIIHQKDSYDGNTEFYLAFSNSPIYLDKASSLAYYRSIDKSKFVFIQPNKTYTNTKKYSVGFENFAYSGGGSSRMNAILYELNLE